MKYPYATKRLVMLYRRCYNYVFVSSPALLSSRTYNIAGIDICSGDEKLVHYVNLPESGGLDKDSILILLVDKNMEIEI